MDAVSNAHERKRRGRNALELIQAEYRLPVIAGPFEELYLQLTSGPSGQRAAHQSDIDVRALYQPGEARYIVTLEPVKVNAFG